MPIASSTGWRGAWRSESIAGALVYGIEASDRPLVRAFARGVERTQRVRFDHPGLGTVATRSGDALVMQNDIGETDAHVVVVKVVGRAVTVIYTDVHLPRLLFFQRMLAGGDIHWEDTRSRSERRGERGSLSPCRRPLRGRRSACTGGLPGDTRLAHGLPDRLEPRAQASAQPGGKPRCGRAAGVGSRARARAYGVSARRRRAARLRRAELRHRAGHARGRVTDRRARRDRRRSPTCVPSCTSAPRVSWRDDRCRWSATRSAPS